MPDFVGHFTGGNPASSDRTPKGHNALKEIFKVMVRNGPTVHGCSGPVVSAKCNDSYGDYNSVLVGPNGVK